MIDGWRWRPLWNCFTDFPIFPYFLEMKGFTFFMVTFYFIFLTWHGCKIRWFKSTETDSHPDLFWRLDKQGKLLWLIDMNLQSRTRLWYQILEAEPFMVSSVIIILWSVLIKNQCFTTVVATPATKCIIS